MDASSRNANASTIPHACPVCNGSRARFEREIDGYCLVRCPECRMVYVWPRPGREANRTSYATGHRGASPGTTPIRSAAELFDQSTNELTPFRRYALERRLAALARHRTIRRLLDFGCGSGHTLGLARRLLGCETYGIELNPVGELGAERLGFALHAGPLEEVPWPRASFDLVYAVQVFEHLTDPPRELAQLTALLAPGGLLFVEVPNYGSLSIRLGRDPMTANRPPGHLNFFTRQSLTRLLCYAGLEILRLRTTVVPYHAGLPRAHAPAARAGSARPGRMIDFQAPPAANRRFRARAALASTASRILTVPGWGMQLEAIARRP
jgi:SAM-dependent methyltransferase